MIELMLEDLNKIQSDRRSYKDAQKSHIGQKRETANALKLKDASTEGCSSVFSYIAAFDHQKRDFSIRPVGGRLSARFTRPRWEER